MKDMGTTIETYRHTFHMRLQKQLEIREQLRQNALQIVLTRVPKVIADFPSIRRAYLFGSLTRPGGYDRQSDVDIAVEGASAEEYFELWRALEDVLPDLTVDLRDLTPDSYFGRQVCKGGVLLYERGNSSLTG
jgi:predicted nucleotidyltransferase